MKCVIPAAGLGTRFLPATKNSPKEMLPLVDKPAIQYVVEEAVASGIDDIIIVTGRGKQAIENHFDIAFELEHVLREKNDMQKLEQIRMISDLADIQYVRQKKALGLGHAVLCAEKHVGDEPFVVMLGDDVVFSDIPCTKQLLDIYEKYNSSVIAVEKIADELIETYGIIDHGEPLNGNLYPILDLIEKPKPVDAPSHFGILGRYILTPAIFDCIRNTPPDFKGEIQLTDALRLLKNSEDVFGLDFIGRRYDLGNKLEWLKTNIDVALHRDEFRKGLLDFLRKKLIEEEIKR